MTLTDTGALVALLDTDDSYHTACVAAAQRLPAGPLLTTWVCFTEAMYLLGTVGGHRYQAALWSLERLSPEVGRDVFDGFSVAYLILLLGHVAVSLLCADKCDRPL